MDSIYDRQISFAIVFQICALFTNYTVKHILQINSSSARASVSLFFMLLVGMVFLKSLPAVLHRKGRTLIVMYLVSFIVFTAHIIIFPGNLTYLPETVLYFFLINIPTFIFYLAIIDKQVFTDMLVKSAYYQISLVIIFYFTKNLLTNWYDSVFSYLAVIPVILLMIKYLKNRKVIDLVLALFGIYVITVIGSRGPLASILMFVFLYIICGIDLNHIKYRTLLLCFAGLLAGAFLIVYWDVIVGKLFLYLQSRGITSRTLLILANIDSIDFSSGRIPIYREAAKAIYYNPFFGLGIGGDRLLLNGTYPHNIFLEVLINFGVVLGSLLIVYALVRMIISFYKCKNNGTKQLMLMYFSIGFVPLLFSGSYLTSTNFWIYLAIVMSRNGKAVIRQGIIY